jgi:hypothetical protein
VIAVSCVYFLFAIICAWSFTDLFGFHSFTGLYDLWRAHISLIAGLILAGFISQRRKDGLFIGLMLALKWNIAFSLLQVVSDGYLVELMLKFSSFGDAHAEYRSGIVRTVGFFTNPNVNAWFIALYLYYLMSLIKPNKLWVFLSLVALFTTSSRTVIFTSLIIIAFQYAKINNISMLGFVRKYFLYIALVVGAIFILESLNERSSATGYSLIPDIEVITDVREGKVEDSYFRAFALGTCIERFLQSPIIGWGPGNYGTPSSFRSHSKYLSEDGYDHFIDEGMTQLDLLIPLLLPETGLIGLIMWIAVMSYLLRLLRVREPGSARAQVTYLWCLQLIINAFVGPGITHPLIVAILPVVVLCSINEIKTDMSRIAKFVSC